MILVLATTIAVLVSAQMSPAALLDLIHSGNVEAMEGILQSGGTASAIAGVGSLLAVSALRAALLVPLAGAASGRDANGQPHTPLAGFGTGFIPLTALVCISYVAFPLLLMGIFALITRLGLGDVLEEAMANIGRLEQEGDWPAIGWQELLIIASIWIGWIWIFCLQCAGAVLYFSRGADDTAMQQAAPRAEIRQVENRGAPDIRALRKSRSAGI